MVDCKKYADEILDSIVGRGHLAVISVGNNPASMSYIKGKRKDCERVGFNFSHLPFPEDADERSIVDAIKMLNANTDVTGIIVQLPLPDHLDADVICGYIDREKDVDGFRLDSPFKPCTPEGIVYLLKRELGDLAGKRAVIVGRGRLVGKPLMQMLLDEDMTVCICHRQTKVFDMDDLFILADAIIVAIGQLEEIDINTHSGAVIIDCGVNKGWDGKLYGDVGYCDSDRRTPVPGGVGLLTRAMLMKHVERYMEVAGVEEDDHATD